MAITFQVGFQVSDRELKDSLKGIQTDIQNAFNIKGGMSTEIQNATKEAISLEKALKRATTDKGISYYSLQAELAKAGTSATQLVSILTKGGESFKASLNAANTALATADRSVISLNSKIKEMARVTVQSFKFSAAQTMIQGVSNAVREAYQWVEELNSAITDIGVVTGKTAGELDLVTQSAIKGAKELRVAAADYAEGQLIFYQQGLNDKEVQRRTEITVKAAAAANQSMREMSSQLTAIWNTYQMGADEQARAASVGAKMAADTAVDFADIATAMQTAAAPAAQMGVSYNSLAAIISTVGDTTQQSASVIGNAFKTIFSRFQQLKSEGTDGEITLNRVSSQLQELGVNVLDSAGELRQLDDVIHEVGEQWDGWSSKQQLAIAQLVGGTRQYGQFLALMQNYGKYQDLLQSANLEDGSALESQYEASLESIESYALNAGEAWNRAFGEALDPDMIKGFLSIVEDAGDVFGGIVEGVGGLKGGLMIVAGIFAKQIVPATGRALANIKVMATSLTTEGRKKNITSQYDNMISQNKVQQNSATSQTELQNIKLQGQKLENDKKIALINEDINTKLKTASGAYKIQLEYQQQQIKNEQQKLQILGDQALEIQRQAEALEKTQAKQVGKAKAKIQGTSLDEIDAQISDANMDKMMAEADIEVYKQQLGKINSKISSTSNPQKLNNLTRQRIETEEALTRALERQKAAEQDLDNLKKKRESFVKNSEIAQVSKLNSSLTELAKNTAKTSTEGVKLKDSVKSAMVSAVKEIKVLGTELDTVDKDEISGLIRSMLHWGDLTEEEIRGMIQKVKELATEIKGTDDAVGVLDAALDNAETTSQSKDTVEKTGQSTDPQGPAEGEVEDRAMQARAAVGDLAQGVMQIGGAATMAYGACSMLMSVWTDESAGAVEKIMAIISALTMIGPAISMGAQGFQVFGKGIVQAALSMGLFGSQAAAAGGTTAAAGVLAQTGWGPFLPLIIAITAAIAALVAIGAFLIGEFSNSTPQAQLDKTKEAAEGLASAAEEAKTAADNLRSSIEGYDSAVDKLNDCVVGTDEWTQALKEANAAAQDLITNLPDNADITDLYYRNEDTGLIEFDEQKLNNIQKDADIQAQKADYASQVGAVSVQQKTNEVTLNNLANDLSSASMHTDEYGNSNFTTSSKMKEILENHMAELVEATDAETFKEKLESFGADLGDTSTNFQELYEQTQALAASQENAAAKADLFAQMKVDEILGDKYNAEVKQVAGDRLTASTEEWEQKYLGALTNGKFGSSEESNRYGDIYQAQSKIDQGLMDEYNKLTGKNWQSSGNGVQGTDSNRIFEFINEEGEIVQLRAEQVAAEMAAAKALEEVTGSAESASKALSNIQSDYSEDFNNFITSGNFNTMSEDEIMSNFGIDSKGNADLEKTREYAESVFGGEEGLRQMVAATLGKSAEEITEEEITAYVQQIADGAETSFTALENIGNNLSETAKKSFDKIDLSSATVEGQQKVSQAMEQVYSEFGKAGADKFAEIMNGMDPEQAAIFAEKLDQINWQDASPEYLKEQFEELGIPLDILSEESLPDLISLMQVAAKVDFSSATESFNKIKEATSGIEGNTSTITEEQMAALEEAGISADAYFQKMADGTYQLTMDADEFLQMTHDMSLRDMRQVVQEAQEKAANLSRFQNYAGQEMTDERLDNNTALQRMALSYTGNLTEGQKSDLNALKIQDQEAYAAKVKEYYDQANLSADAISASMAEAAQEAQEAQQAIDDADFQFDVEQAGLDLDETTRYAERIAKDMAEAAGETDLSSDALKKYEKAARQAAINNQKLDRGLGNLNDNLDDYKKKLKDSNKGTAEWSDAMDDLKTDLADIVGFDDPDLLTDDFAEATLNSEDLKAALDGDVEAIKRLQTAAADDMMINIVANQSANPDQIRSEWEQLKLDFANTNIDSPDVDQTNLINSFNDMIAKGNMTKDQIEAALAGLHVSANVKTEYIAQKTTVPTTITEQTRYKTGTDMVDVDMDGTAETPVARWRTETNTFEGPPKEVDGYVPKYTIEGTEGEGGVTTAFVSAPAPKVSSGATTSGRKSGGSGGGGSTPKHQAKKAEKRQSMKIDDRYSSVQSKIDDVQRSLDNLSSQQDDMWGGAHLRALAKYNKELEKQAGYYKEMLKMAKKYTKEDQVSADALRKETGNKIGANLIGIQFDDDGFVKNRTEIINQLDDELEKKYQVYKQAADAYDTKKSTSQEESDRIDKLKEEYEDYEKYVNDYIASIDQIDDSAMKAYETLQKLVEGIRQEIANRVEIITYKIELKMDMNDLEIRQLERSIEHLGEVGLETGKRFGKLRDIFTKNADAAWMASDGIWKLETMLNNLNTEAGKSEFIDKFGPEAWEEYASSGVLPAEIIDGIKDYTNTLIDRVDALYENMEEMFDTYLELLDKYIEKFDGIISKIDRSNSKLDVYQQLLEFSGQEYRVEKDGTHSGQEARRNIAKARISGTDAQLEAARASYDTYAKQYEKWVEEEKRFQEKHGSDISSYDEATAAAWNKIQETKKAVEDAMNEADSLIDEKMSQLIDDVTNAIEVGAQIIKEQTVESLNGLFDSFESMTETWDQKETLRLFFLEDYDKTYQLESLLRDVNDAMEDITDPQRMNEYLALVDEINAANAEGVKMTQTDMDLLKAKFELQQAQDLYEEQKNAKNTMRLARDASGNWSYVYSNNQSESEDAVQKLADAQHNYDKLLHEARDESSQLWLQTQQEFFEWQETIDWDRMQWDTKYKDQVNRTYKYYVDMTSLYADQVTKYNAMLGDNYADTTLGIITGYDSMEEAQAAYTEQHATYNTELEANQTELSQVVRDKCEDMGIDYDNLAQDVQDKTDDIIDENNRLKEDAWDLAAEADDALSDMADSVSSNIDDMIAAIQELEAEIQRAIDLLASLTDQSTTGFDAERDYTATAYNKVKNMDEEQAKAFFNSREGQLMAQEWVNKVNSDLMNGHSYTIGGKNYKYGDEATKQDFIDAIMEGVREGTIKGNIEYDERDESKISQGVGDTGSDYNAIYGRPRTASGGLIRTPQVRSVAEEGAELILNSTDTQNILDAVTHMREVVRMKIQAANLGVDSMVKKPDPIVVQSDAAPIDQQVHIDATFPNVSVAAEIEEAFNNLVNQAVQYVSAKNK